MITQFAFRLICGMSLVWCVMPRREVASGFFRIQMLVTLGLSALAAVSATTVAPAVADGGSSLLSVAAIHWLAGATAIMSFLGSVLWTLERRGGAMQFGVAITLASLCGTVLLCSSPASWKSLPGSLFWLAEVSTALVSGATVGGMLLGHWYLTAPSMTTQPLNRVNYWLGITGLTRLSVAVAALAVGWQQIAGSSPAAEQLLKPGTTFTAGLSSTHLVWLSLDWLGGVLGPLAVCVMVQRILRYGNTQSATGVLFVGVILAFMGEMAGALLRRELHLPL